MNNSRSQTKIRKIQSVNLIAEQRYLKNKGLLKENINDFKDCFYRFGLSDDEIPQSCRSITNREEFVKCKNDINTALVSMGRPSGQSFESLFTCLETKAINLGIFIDITDPLELDTEDELEDKKNLAKELFSEEEYSDLLKRLLAAETLEEFYDILDEEGQTLDPNPED